MITQFLPFGNRCGILIPKTEVEYMADIQPGRYRHFKGNEYQVLGIARHS